MKRTQKVFIDFAAVKAAITITQVLSHYDLLNKFRQSSNADEWRSRCPLHGGDNSSEFSINTSKNVWNCFSECHRGGNVLDFVSLKEQVDIHDAALLLDDWFDLGLTKGESPERLVRPAKKARRKPRANSSTATPQEGDQAGRNRPLGFDLKNLGFDHPYLEERGIPPALAESLGVGFCSRGSMAGRIAIPLHNATGQLVGYMGRWPGEPPEERPKYKLPNGFRKSAELYNFHRALEHPPETPLVIVEGIFDVIALTRAGFPKCIALLGSCLSVAQERLLSDAHASCPLLTLLLDEDEAGQRGREAALNRLAYRFHVRVVRLPRKGSQPEDLGAEQLEELLDWKNCVTAGHAVGPAQQSDGEPCHADVSHLIEGAD